jgi:hypothetical protein
MDKSRINEKGNTMKVHFGGIKRGKETECHFPSANEWTDD